MLATDKGKILSSEQLTNVRTEDASVRADDVTFRTVPIGHVTQIAIYDDASGMLFAVVDTDTKSCGGDITVQWDDRGIIFDESLTGNLPPAWEPVFIH